MKHYSKILIRKLKSGNKFEGGRGKEAEGRRQKAVLSLLSWRWPLLLGKGETKRSFLWRDGVLPV